MATRVLMQAPVNQLGMSWKTEAPRGILCLRELVLAARREFV